MRKRSYYMHNTCIFCSIYRPSEFRKIKDNACFLGSGPLCAVVCFTKYTSLSNQHDKLMDFIRGIAVWWEPAPWWRQQSTDQSRRQQSADQSWRVVELTQYNDGNYVGFIVNYPVSCWSRLPPFLICFISWPNHCYWKKCVSKH